MESRKFELADRAVTQNPLPRAPIRISRIRLISQNAGQVGRVTQAARAQSSIALLPRAASHVTHLAGTWSFK